MELGLGSPQSTYGSGVRSSSVSPSTVTRSSLPPVDQQASAGPIVLQPRQALSKPLRVSSTDPMTTNSIAGSGAPKPASGWDKTNGTWVTVRFGETLYNISRRYGVPVSAIMKANSISNGDAVSAGSRILIPTYQYSVPHRFLPQTITRLRVPLGPHAGSRGRRKVRSPCPEPVRRTWQHNSPSNNRSRRTVQSLPTRSTTQCKRAIPFLALPSATGLSMAALKTANNMNTDVVRLGAALDDTGIRHSCNRQHSQIEWDCRWNQVDQAEA